MDELMTTTTNQLLERTPVVIAAEINSIKEQTKKILLSGSIEIGRRLVEAKGIIEHGQWGEWLEKSVNYSQRTAQVTMQLFEQYGSEQIGLFGNNVKAQAFAHLGYSQAVALLGIPDEERVDFVEGHDLDSMSTRELAQAIKERDEARIELDNAKVAAKYAKDTFDIIARERDAAKSEADKVKSEAKETEDALWKAKVEAQKLEAKLMQEREDNRAEVHRLDALIARANKEGTSDGELAKIQAELQQAQDKVKELTEELEKPADLEPAIIEKVPEDVTKELEDLRARASLQTDPAVVIFATQFEMLKNSFGDLLNTLASMEGETKERYTGACRKLLVMMSERL